MTRWLPGAVMIVASALWGCGDGRSPTAPTRPEPPIPTAAPPPDPAPAASLKGIMTVSSALTRTGGYEYTVQIQLTQGAGVPETIASVDLAGDDGWGTYPPIGHFASDAWGSNHVVPANGVSKSRPLVAIDEAPLRYYDSLRATITFSDGSVGSRTVAIDASSPPAPDPPPGATFRVAGMVWDERHTGMSGATVEVQGGANAGRKAVTDADGTYTLDGLATGPLTVRFSKVGYEASSHSALLKSNLTISRELQLPR